MHFHLGLKHKLMRRESGITIEGNHSYIAFLDKLTLFAGIAGPFTVIPQIYKIFSTHDASGVSATAWALLFIVTLPWIFYGIAHKDKAIIYSFILWEFANVLVFVGALLYS